MPIKVFLDNDSRYTAETHLMAAYDRQALWDELGCRGIERVVDGKDSDLVLAPGSSLQENLRPSTVVIEKVDGCQLSLKKWLSNPNVLSWIKMYRYADSSVYKLPLAGGRIFTRHLTDSIVGDESELPVGFEKITLGLTFLHYERHVRQQEIALSAELNQDREIDVFFAGTTEYKSSSPNMSASLITEHRQSLVKYLSELNGLNTVYGSSRMLSGKEYISTLQNAKITISPWGWGEACFRDYEAMLHGCEVIKPATYEMKSNPSIFNEDNMTFCNPHWTGLETLIKDRLATWGERAEQRKQTQRLVLDAMSITYQASILEQILGQAYAAKSLMAEAS